MQELRHFSGRLEGIAGRPVLSGVDMLKHAGYRLNLRLSGGCRDGRSLRGWESAAKVLLEFRGVSRIHYFPSDLLKWREGMCGLIVCLSGNWWKSNGVGQFAEWTGRLWLFGIFE